jgi:hypothetical protein
MKWVITEGIGYCRGKPIAIWHVGPPGETYGYATFLSLAAAKEYLLSISGR